jgi:hypothetical protein
VIKNSVLVLPGGSADLGQWCPTSGFVVLDFPWHMVSIRGIFLTSSFLHFFKKGLLLLYVLDIYVELQNCSLITTNSQQCQTVTIDEFNTAKLQQWKL